MGRDFHGFQRQPGLRTVESELLGALEEVGVIENLGQSNYSIAGRTDRGVHALGNVVSFRTRKMPIINQVNDILPRDIGFWDLHKCQLDLKPDMQIKDTIAISCAMLMTN